ncbi:cell envelope biogenesis protein OmpA [Sinomicrobium weinanense]|uniref:Cell envelope biogenesis protein OmpA n=1 Tax=Sinomicrobium weinanense TaxID=2842200 RepID=A0A926JUL4_9FLAO|nr:cell envelope biogenesis protein OmpA [Sinomicrobium weinanense]MBC9797481.1 cell envelope biogenesis protein OmpA [Sinomicrobium weinanense]MBU3124473.1 cell envelope biogenesis protein OmpA [Sinomicrobium weinanense]
MNENDKLNILKDILLTDDREYAESIVKRMETLENLVHTRSKLSDKVDPIIDHKLDEFIHEIPRTLGPTITETLKTEIKNSKDQVVEALYPIMGKMIKKYVWQEIKLLSERVSKQVEDSFSAKSWKRRVKSWFTGVKEHDLILSELGNATIEQVFVIEKNSGILLGNYSKTETIDKEMFSGMLTAIKSFVEDAFQQKGQNLELIEYELYNIHIQSFVSYYIAVVISGQYTTPIKNKLQDIIFNFSQNFLSLVIYNPDITKNDIVNELNYYFNNDRI